MKMTSAQMRDIFLKYYEARGHTIVPSASLIPENDPTTLFTGSGMQPMVPYLLGEKHPSGTRIVDSQKCFRAADIDDIGDNRHTTFFEMLGNWSLGDYFKTEQIKWAFDLYINQFGLDPSRVYISVYRGNEKYGIPRDDEAVTLWKELFADKGVDAPAVDMAERDGMQGGRIFYFDEKENWWSRAGVPDNMPVGEPGGPDSEMFWDFGAELGLHEKSEYNEQPCHPACDCGRFLEFANNVFMQYKKKEDGFVELEHKNIDFGGGLERIAVAIHDTPDVFLGDLFDGIRNKIEEFSGKKYGADEKETKAFRVIMDHLRVVVFLIADGASPSNKDQGYFTRRMLRRAIRFARDLGIESGLSAEVAEVVIAEYSSHYSDLAAQKDFIIAEIENEEKQFLTTLEKGLKELKKLVQKKEDSNFMQVKGEYKLLGASILSNELSTEEMLDNSKNIGNFLNGFDGFYLYETYGFPLEMLQEELSTGIEYINRKTGTIEKTDNAWKVHESEFNKAKEKHSELSRAGAEQKFKGGLADASEATTELHSATHLLLAGLRHVLGDHVFQRGSNITAERLRFDFSQDDKVTAEQLQEVEDFVNHAIESGMTVGVEEVPKQEAIDRGVVGSFWEKYPDIVKVYTMQSADEVFSVELCGGPHVQQSVGMGKFKIQKEEASSRGVRRIKAILEK